LLYSPAPRPVCVAIPSGSHCDASSAPRPVLIPRARAEMLGPLCTRNISDTTSTSVHWPSAFCGSAMWLVAAPSNPGMPTCCASDGAHIICPRVCIPGVCTVGGGGRLAPVRSVPRSSVHPRRDPLCSRTALPTHCECPRRGEGFDPAAGTSLTRRPITLVYFPFPHCTVVEPNRSPHTPHIGTSRSSTRLFPKHSPLASPPPLSFPISRYLLPVLTSLGTATGVRISFGSSRLGL